MIGAEMKRIRRKLHLTQKETVKLLSGGGHNAFSRYERGELTAASTVVALCACWIVTLICSPKYTR